MNIFDLINNYYLVYVNNNKVIESYNWLKNNYFDKEWFKIEMKNEIIKYDKEFTFMQLDYNKIIGYNIDINEKIILAVKYEAAKNEHKESYIGTNKNYIVFENKNDALVLK